MGDYAQERIDDLTKLNEITIENRKLELENNDKILESYVKTAAEAMKLDEEAQQGAKAVTEELEKYGTTLEIIRDRLEDSKLAFESWKDTISRSLNWRRPGKISGIRFPRSGPKT